MAGNNADSYTCLVRSVWLALVKIYFLLARRIAILDGKGWDSMTTVQRFFFQCRPDPREIRSYIHRGNNPQAVYNFNSRKITAARIEFYSTLLVLLVWGIVLGAIGSLETTV